MPLPATAPMNAHCKRMASLQEEKMIAAQKVQALMPAPGLKSLGWKGDDRFKNPVSCPEGSFVPSTVRKHVLKAPDKLFDKQGGLH